MFLLLLDVFHKEDVNKQDEEFAPDQSTKHISISNKDTAQHCSATLYYPGRGNTVNRLRAVNDCRAVFFFLVARENKCSTITR